MEPQIAIPVAPKGDFEVTGVSRSGRVRKKSSKLLDFQSPDEIETRARKATPAKQTIGKLTNNFSAGRIGSPAFVTNDHHKSPHEQSLNSGLKSDVDMMSIDFHGEQAESGESDSDEHMDDAVEDEAEDNFTDPTVRQSIYMSEKSNKKKVMKDGKVVYGKAQRKDKGKTRVTAYMLWARDARKQMLSQQPDLDFASISRRLGELWANVPTSVKYHWKRRAKQLATKGNTTDRKDAPKAPSKFLNRGQQSNNNNIGNNVSSVSTPTPTSRSKKHTKESDSLSSPTDSSDHHNQPHSKKSNSSAHKVSPIMTQAMYKVTGIEPVDVAAHLKLLGDSLTIIGERLKEHEGQITVSGSLSVLLDSLLCSLGPLMCLTTQIPGMRSSENQRLRESLQNTLDNIAYVMPGL